MPAAESPHWAFEALKRFRVIINAVQQHSQSVESSCGVTSDQLWAMWEIEKASGIGVGELANTMAIHQSTASNLLARLEKKSYIRRERDQIDQRVVRLFLTSAGQALMASIDGPKRGLLQQALFELPTPSLQALTASLDVLITEMHIRDTEAAMRPLLSKPDRKPARRSKSEPSED